LRHYRNDQPEAGYIYQQSNKDKAHRGFAVTGHISCGLDCENGAFLKEKRKNLEEARIIFSGWIDDLEYNMAVMENV
jgi:hypothetical protein